MDPLVCLNGCDEGWLCEAHSDRPWPHDDCPGPGYPCRDHFPFCPFWVGADPIALHVVIHDPER